MLRFATLTALVSLAVALPTAGHAAEAGILDPSVHDLVRL